MGRAIQLLLCSVTLLALSAWLGCGTGAREGPASSRDAVGDAPAEGDDRARTPPDRCEVVGRWRGVVPGGILRGVSLDLVFSEEGTARGVASWVTLETTWEREGDTIAITDIAAVPALATCPSDVVGRYGLEFDVSCSAVRVVSADDGCTHRRLSLHGLSATRL